MANFTGGVRSLDGADLRVARFQYEAGARSYWHAHDGLQLLMPESGRLRFQIRGQKIQELGPNQPVYLPAGVAHWHGGTPDQGLTQIAVNMGGVKWMGAVSDDEYLGKVASPR
jgi:quercetin dioxygenase-like cupin family protein